MHSVDNDREDAFRRAAKDYPLNIESADWSKVARALYNEDISISSPSVKRGRKYWWLILLPFSVWCNHYIETRNESIVETKIDKTVQSVEQRGTVAVKRNSIDKENTAHSSFLKNTPGRSDVLEEQQNSKHKILLSNSSSIPVNDITPTITNRIASIAAIQKIEVTPLNAIRYQLPGQPVSLANPFILSKSFVQGKNSLQKESNKAKAKRDKKFFLGIEGGIGKTTVKLQRTAALGFDFGVVAGLDISKHLTIETSVLSSKKFYYTDGKDFSTKKIYLPANTKILSVDGHCRMIELPLALRYNFSTSNSKWFAAAGVSSFLMKQEAYDYDYLYTASGQSVKRSKAYANSSKDWAAVAQVSGGYLYDAKAKFEVKAEPYLQVPLKGVGVGQLSLGSAGLRITLVKKLF